MPRPLGIYSAVERREVHVLNDELNRRFIVDDWPATPARLSVSPE
jgi:hypothetical protein